MASYESNVASFWKPGTSLSVEPSGKTVKVSDDGSVKVTGLEEYVQYRLEGEGRAVQFTAKSDETRGTVAIERSAAEGARVRALTQQKRAGQPLPSAAPGKTTTPNTVTGARSSSNVKGRHQTVLTDQLSEDRKVAESDPRPAPNQVDVQGTPQRSDTPFGQATPKDPKEKVPAESQEDAKGPQRSDTEFGTAAPKVRSEVEPAQRQEDAPKGLKQMSDTPDGSIAPKESQSRARGKAGVREGVKAEKRRESSARKVGADKPSAQKTGKPTSARKKK